MADDEIHPPIPVVNGWLAKAQVISVFVKNLGVSTILIGVIIAWLSGWVPFPLLAVLGAISAGETAINGRLDTLTINIMEHRKRQEDLMVEVKERCTTAIRPYENPGRKTQ